LSAGVLREAQLYQVGGVSVEELPRLSLRQRPALVLLERRARFAEDERALDRCLFSTDSARCAEDLTKSSSDRHSDSESSDDNTCNSQTTRSSNASGPGSRTRG